MADIASRRLYVCILFFHTFVYVCLCTNIHIYTHTQQLVGRLKLPVADEARQIGSVNIYMYILYIYVYIHIFECIHILFYVHTCMHTYVHTDL